MSIWGRKETIYWPPRTPVYSLTAIAGALLCTCVFVWQSYRFQQTPAEQFYTGEYLRSDIGAVAHQKGNYRILYVLRGNSALPATADDVVRGAKHLQSPSGRLLYGPARPYVDARFHAWLQHVIYRGQNFLTLYGFSFVEGGAVLFISLLISLPADIKRRKVMKYGRRLKGPIMLTPKEWNDTLNGEGIGIRTRERGEILRLPLADEPKHIQVMGDTGSGKSTLLMQMLTQIRDRGEVAIILDPAGEYIQRFHDAKRKDVVLNPLDARCPFWSPADELRNVAEARTIAASLFQPPSRQKGEFFPETAQKVFARLLQYKDATPSNLAKWMANPDEIDKRVHGTPIQAFISPNAQPQRQGVLATLGLVAEGLTLLPTREQSSTTWSANAWSTKREGWIFLTGKESEQESIRPLHSLWIDLLILRLLQPLSLNAPPLPKVWFVLDEVAGLQRLPQFHTALTKGRKSGNPIIFGYQGKAQIEDTYGQLAEVMLSQPATKFVLRTGEPKAAKWASELLGEVEIERQKETVANGLRRGTTMTMDRQVEPLVMASEIEGLSDLHAFAKLGNNVTRFRFERLDLPVVAEAFESRAEPEGDFWLTLPDDEPKPAAPKRFIPEPGSVDLEDETDTEEAPFSIS